MRYQLGLLSLLENSEKFFSIFPRALKSGDISIDEAREFPIFQEMRKDKRMAPFLKKAKKRNRPVTDQSKKPSGSSKPRQ